MRGALLVVTVRRSIHRHRTRILSDVEADRRATYHFTL